jgi:histidine triad (HIT) family protein
MSSIFSRIVKGEIPSYKVAEDDNFLAFLDVFPLRKGHTLVIPKKEVDYLFDLDESTYNGLFAFSRRVAAALKESVPCKRVSVHVIGLEVPHAHIHLIPIQSMRDCDFSKEKLKFSKEEFQETAAKIAAKVRKP